MCYHLLKDVVSILNMTKRDPYESEARWNKWKNENQFQIKGLSQRNSELVLSFLKDMETGQNVSPVSRKGERSCARLLGLKSRLIFFAEQLNPKDIDNTTKDEIHQCILDMRQGRIVKSNGNTYRGVSNFVRDFKAFWGWLIRTGRANENITLDLRKSDGRKPDWVYLTEEEFKRLANQTNGDYRALIWFMYDTGARVTEAYSIKIMDFSHDFTRLNIRQEYAKTFGRVIKLKLCPPLIKEYVRVHNLQPNDFLFVKKPAAFNKYLRAHAGRLLGDAKSPARKAYDKMTLYDIRHNASCYWLKRYQKTRSVMYRMGWSEEKQIRYYSEFLGLADELSDEDMVTAEDKSIYEKRIEKLEQDRGTTNVLVHELISKITSLQKSVLDRADDAQQDQNFFAN